MTTIELLKEARGASVKVLDGLNARIDRASKQGEPIPVYNGIVELHDIIGKIDSYLSALSTAEQERDALKARCAELEARLQGAGWISVDEQLPEALQRVFMVYITEQGKKRIDVGQYIPPKTILEEDFLDSEINAQFLSTYDKENNCYWVNEGWFEDHWQAEVNYKIHDVVTHWMPLPEPPILGEKKE